MTSRRAAARSLAALLGVCATIGCVDPVPPETDSGMPVPDAWTTPGVPGRVVLLAPSNEGPSVPIDLFALRIHRIRIVGDRGPAFDPVIEGPGLVTIGEAGLELDIDDVPPALYSAVVVTLEAEPEEAGAPVLELRITLDPGPTLDIRTAAPLELTARCEHGRVVNTTDAVEIGVDFALADAVAIALAHPLPAPDGEGVIWVDDVSAPDAIADFRAMLVARVHAECEAGEI